MLIDGAMSRLDATATTFWKRLLQRHSVDRAKCHIHHGSSCRCCRCLHVALVHNGTARMVWVEDEEVTN